MAPKKKYTKEQMQNALSAVRDGMPFSTASKAFRVPRVTLLYKFKGKSPEDCRMGPSTVLSTSEEELLVKWILHIGKSGFPITKERLCDSVQMLMKKLQQTTVFKDNRPGRHWFESFMRRHPEISTRTPQNLTNSRASVTETHICKWFEEIYTYYSENDIINVLEYPDRIFNCDETAFFLSPKENKVIVKKGERAVYNFINNDEKECLTTLITGNAAGELAPPMIMFSYQRLPNSIMKSLPENWSAGKSDNGWMTSESFFEYVANTFYPWVIKSNIQLPIILYVDGHVSHITMALSEFCKEKGIVLVALLANSTHVLQPMDVAVFRPVKQTWKKVIHNWRVNNNGARLKREHFASLLKETLDSIDMKTYLINGFRKCGLFPFNGNAVDYSRISQTVCTEPARSQHKNATESKELLRSFERKLSKEKQALFASAGTVWKGPVEDVALFNFWIQLKKEAGDEPNPPRIDANANNGLIQLTDEIQAQFSNSVANLNSHSSGSTADNSAMEVETYSIKNIADTTLKTSTDDLNFQANARDLTEDASTFAAIDLICSNSEVKSKQVTKSKVLHVENNNVIYIQPEGNAHMHNIVDTVGNMNNALMTSIDAQEGNFIILETCEVVHDADPANLVPVTTLEEISFNHDMQENIKNSKINGTEVYSKMNDVQQKEGTVAEQSLENIPPAFKDVLFWPKKREVRKGRRKYKEKLPSVITSEQWHKNQNDQEEKKKALFLQKEDKKRQREEKALVLSEAKRLRLLAKQIEATVRPSTKLTIKTERS